MVVQIGDNVGQEFAEIFRGVHDGLMLAVSGQNKNPDRLYGGTGFRKSKALGAADQAVATWACVMMLVTVSEGFAPCEVHALTRSSFSVAPFLTPFWGS